MLDGIKHAPSRVRVTLKLVRFQYRGDLTTTGIVFYAVAVALFAQALDGERTCVSLPFVGRSCLWAWAGVDITLGLTTFALSVMFLVGTWIPLVGRRVGASLAGAPFWSFRMLVRVVEWTFLMIGWFAGIVPLLEPASEDSLARTWLTVLFWAGAVWVLTRAWGVGGESRSPEAGSTTRNA